MNLPPFAPIERVLQLTKQVAAARQVHFAVEALRHGDYDVAITLAGAAENMVDGDPDIEITSKILASQAGADVPPDYKWSEIVNLERNWLKHKTDLPKMPKELTLTVEEASHYVYRAMRKLPLELLTPEMYSMETWYRLRIAEEIAKRSPSADN